MKKVIILFFIFIFYSINSHAQVHFDFGQNNIHRYNDRNMNRHYNRVYHCYGDEMAFKVIKLNRNNKRVDVNRLNITIFYNGYKRQYNLKCIE